MKTNKELRNMADIRRRRISYLRVTKKFYMSTTISRRTNRIKQGHNTFYDQLDRIFNIVPKHDTILLLSGLQYQNWKRRNV